MNDFFSCARRGRAVDTYYKEVVKLSRDASLMIEGENLSQIILGLEGKLVDEVEAL